MRSVEAPKYPIWVKPATDDASKKKAFMPHSNRKEKDATAPEARLGGQPWARWCSPFSSPIRASAQAVWRARKRNSRAIICTYKPDPSRPKVKRDEKRIYDKICINVPFTLFGAALVSDRLTLAIAARSIGLRSLAYNYVFTTHKTSWTTSQYLY